MKNNLNPQSRLATFYRYFYLTNTLPNNLCAYFWALFFAFIFLPFVWIAVIINYKQNKIKRYKDSKYIFKNNVVVDNISFYRYLVSNDAMKTMSGFFLTLLAMIIGATVYAGVLQLNPVVVNNMGLFKALTFLYLVGILSVLSIILIILIIIGLFKIINTLIYSIKKEPTLEQKLEKERKTMEYEEKRREKEREKEKYREDNPNFLAIAWRWVVAFKEKNCPLLEWNYEIKSADEETKN